MSGFEQFESYKYLQNLTFDELKLAVNYICSNLNSYPCYNYHQFIMNFLKEDYTFFPLVTKLNEIYYELFDWTEKAFTLVCV